VGVIILTELIEAEYPGWQVYRAADGLVWLAFWKSEDGRHRRIIVAASTGLLLRKLREARHEATPTGPSAEG
jgi:hypothetical protein